MPIRQITPMSEIDRYTEQRLKGLEQTVIRTLAYCGEVCLNAARSTNSYKDRTGNLRSSIGYVVAVDGRIVNRSDFKTVRMEAKARSKARRSQSNLSDASRKA